MYPPHLLNLHSIAQTIENGLTAQTIENEVYQCTSLSCKKCSNPSMICGLPGYLPPLKKECQSNILHKHAKVAILRNCV